MFEIEEELKKLPAEPGVYIMHGLDDAIIYIGKAIKLNRRVPQYFRHQDSRPMVEKMVPQITRFEYIVTDSELEALVLECNLIKEHRPKYNTMLKDDKTYPYIKVTVGEDYPRVFVTRQMRKDNSKYFGPYTNATAVKETVDLLQKLYLLRTCRRHIDGVDEAVIPGKEGGSSRERACLNYHMHRCPAPCQGYITTEEYRKNIDKILRFLAGNFDEVIKELTTKMQEAAAELRFEEAGEYKALIGQVREVAQKQKITSGDGEDKDILALAADGTEAVMQVFFVRDGKLIGREHFYLKVVEGETTAKILTTFLTQYYAGTPQLPKEIMLQEVPEDKEVIEQWLTKKRGSKVAIRIPQKGQKEKLVELAMHNAQMVLSQDRERLKREEGRTIGAAKELARLIGMEKAGRIEAYDISNISGYQNVGSMVVFENGKPLKNDYRKFKIRTVEGQDDYASMYEVLTRRFLHGMIEKEQSPEAELDSFTKFPDLILMDGGRGQVNICKRVLSELELDIKVCGMVKDDNHRTRGLYVDNVEIPIDRHGEAFQLITRIQDEAHRFAIEFHRSLRLKGQVHSVLDEIKGIGPTRRKALIRHFQSIDRIKEASIEELIEAPGMNRAAAEAVFGFFQEASDNRQGM